MGAPQGETVSAVPNVSQSHPGAKTKATNSGLTQCSPYPGGQLRPHAYSRYSSWSDRFGPEGALKLIKHEMAHLDAFKALLAEEGVADDVCFKLGETFDAAMTQEAWARLKGAFEAFVRDHGRDGEVIRDCRLVEDPKEAETITQMKGCIGAIVHPTGQV